MATATPVSPLLTTRKTTAATSAGASAGTGNWPVTGVSGCPVSAA